MKKLFALLLAMILCASLCACGQGQTPTQQPEKGGVIAKPGETSPTEAPAPTSAPADPVKPAETPAPTPTPPPPPEIVISDLCAVSGKLTEAGDDSGFSFRLPEVTGADTPYLRALNEQMRALYDEYVTPALEYMESDGSLMRYCMEYYVGARGGVHSILVTCDSDWGMDEYWCFNFDDYGNEADNETVLKAAGYTPDAFVSAAHDYFERVTDLSAYFEDDGWKTYQEQTLAKDNCNAEMPLAFLPNGDLCFIGTIYTPAGAGEYDHALELTGAGEIVTAQVGTVLLNRLRGAYLVEQETQDGEGFTESEMIEIFSVGDTLTMEVTSFESEDGSASVYSYWAADIFPEDPSELLRADVDGVRVRVVPWCPDVFGGISYGEPGHYTLRATADGIAFTDFEGGTSLTFEPGDLFASRAYPGELGLDGAIPETDYERFDFDAVEKAGIAGIWSGFYRDEGYKIHSLTLELTSWGRMRLRDCVGGAIPRVLEGGYYLSAGDDMAPEGALVFRLAARGGYKMPLIGWCRVFIDAEGTLRLDDDTESDTHLTQVSPEYYALLERVPDVRYAAESAVYTLEDGERMNVDIDGDGLAEEIGCTLRRDPEYNHVIEAATFYLDGAEYTFDELDIYEADVYLMVPALRGAVYFYIDGLSDNDYHVTTVVGVRPDKVWFAGEFSGGFAEAPTDVEVLSFQVRTQLISSVSGARTYRVGLGGLPEAVEPFYHLRNDLSMTALQDVECWIVAPDTGELVDTGTIPAGAKLRPLRTDNASFVDLQMENGDARRVWITDGWPRTVGGVRLEDCFDGVVFAG